LDKLGSDMQLFQRVKFKSGLNLKESLSFEERVPKVNS
jgi:hypothetical protein